MQRLPFLRSRPRLASRATPRSPSPRSSIALALDSGAPMPPRRRSDWAWRLGLARADSDQLAAARLDFADAIADVRTEAAYALQSRIAVARSMHELWHLRADAFDVVSRRHDQAEAEERIASLNRHFG